MLRKNMSIFFFVLAFTLFCSQTVNAMSPQPFVEASINEMVWGSQSESYSLNKSEPFQLKVVGHQNNWLPFEYLLYKEGTSKPLLTGTIGRNESVIYHKVAQESGNYYVVLLCDVGPINRYPSCLSRGTAMLGHSLSD